MRKISLVFLAAVLFTSGNLFATEPATDPSTTLSAQIGELLEDHRLVIKEELTAMVYFTLNDDKEIVVLSVDTEDEDLEGLVKARLNYEKVELDQYTSGKTYKVPVRIEVAA